MSSEPVVSELEMEKLSPNERARLVDERSCDSVDGLSPEFRARVEKQGQRLLRDHGLLEPEHS